MLDVVLRQVKQRIARAFCGRPRNGHLSTGMRTAASSGPHRGHLARHRNECIQVAPIVFTSSFAGAFMWPQMAVTR
jgi:hypothetical protein